MFDIDALGAMQAFARYVARDIAGVATERRLILDLEEERRRVALNLHDDVGHTLTAAIFRLDRDIAKLREGEDQAREALERARASLMECAEALHDMARELRPQVLEDLGLAAALRSLAGRMSRSGAPPTSLAIHGELVTLDKQIELALYRVAQEALTNICKHAQAEQVGILLAYGPSTVAFAVEDDGIGFGDGQLTPLRKGGLGVRGMRERVESLGGIFNIDRPMSGGTRVIAQLPLRVLNTNAP